MLRSVRGLLNGRRRQLVAALLPLVVALAATVLVPAVTAATAAPRPTITLASATLSQKPTGGTVSLRLRICASIGPRAVVLVTERRTIGTRRVAVNSFVDPLGVDQVGVGSYTCFSWEESWLSPRRLSGRGTYSAVVRVRDGYGLLSLPASVSWDRGGSP
jgi:hypothetical protein